MIKNLMLNEYFSDIWPFISKQYYIFICTYYANKLRMYLDVPRPPRCPDVTLVTEYKKQTRLVVDRDKPRGLGTSFMAHKPRGQIPLSLFGFDSGLALD